MGGGFKWIKPEVYPLIFYVGGVVALAAFQATRLVTSHPDVRINKDDRQAGILYNYGEGRKYRDHWLRGYLSDKKAEMMPAMNHFFTDLIGNSKKKNNASACSSD